MVILVSAMLVANTIFLIPSSGLSKINFCLQANKNKKFKRVQQYVNYKNIKQIKL